MEDLLCVRITEVSWYMDLLGKNPLREWLKIWIPGLPFFLFIRSRIRPENLIFLYSSQVTLMVSQAGTLLDEPKAYSILSDSATLKAKGTF